MTKEDRSVGVTVGSILAVFVVAGVGITLVILWRKGIIPKGITQQSNLITQHDWTPSVKVDLRYISKHKLLVF